MLLITKGRWRLVAWTIAWAATILIILIGAGAKLAFIPVFGDFWVMLLGAVALIALVFAADFLADYFFEG